MSHTLCPTESANILHNKLTTLNNICFPWKERKIRLSDHPWITDGIRRGLKRRQRRYRKHKRDAKWKIIKKEVASEIHIKRKEYYDKEAIKAGSSSAPSAPFKVLRHMNDSEKRPTWTVNELRSDLTDSELSEDLASYFSVITDEFEPIDLSSLPMTFSTPFSAVEPHEVAERIKLGKKPLSAVDGDPLPCMIGRTSDILATPATRIINLIFQTKSWPCPRKRETQSVIVPSPSSSYEEIRNISCTNYLSKILETDIRSQDRKKPIRRPKGNGNGAFLS